MLVCRAKGAIVNSHRDETGDFSGKHLELAAWLRPGWWESRAAWLIQELNPSQAVLAPASWYRCDGTVKVTGIAGMDETVIGYLSSAPDARWDPTRKILRPAHACGWDTAVVVQPPKRA
jgi:hypothetical protein